METTNVKAFGKDAATVPIKEMNNQRRALMAKYIEIEIMFCGICHSDLHTTRNDWGFTTYPVVPGHEIVGRVTKVGEGINKLKVGDYAGVGCLVDVCRNIRNA